MDGNLILALAIYAAATKCEPLIGPDVPGSKSTAERIFLAYTNGKIKEYLVKSPEVCDQREVRVIIDGQGKDEVPGASWVVSINLGDRSVTIRRGE